MLNRVLHAAGWLLAGMVLMGLLVWLVMPSVMLVEQKSGRNYEDTIAALSAALDNKRDWRVVALNDYQKSTAPFKQIERVGSMNVCNPRYASMILSHDRDRGVTAMMPLSIGVYEDKSGQVYISRMNVGVMGLMFGGTIAEVMGQVDHDLNEVVAAVATR